MSGNLGNKSLTGGDGRGDLLFTNYYLLFECEGLECFRFSWSSAKVC